MSFLVRKVLEVEIDPADWQDQWDVALSDESNAVNVSGLVDELFWETNIEATPIDK